MNWRLFFAVASLVNLAEFAWFHYWWLLLGFAIAGFCYLVESA